MKKPSGTIHASVSFLFTTVLFMSIYLVCKLIIYIPAVYGALILVALFGAFWSQMYNRMEEYDYEAHQEA